MASYVTTRDIVIPAGTLVGSPPTQSTRWASDYEAVVGHGRDHSSFWSVDIKDALELGLVREAD